MKEENLIFIISQPRSGSTFLQSLLSNNSAVNTCSESWILLNYANQIKPSLIQGKYNNDLALQAFNDYVQKFPELNYSDKQRKFILSLYKPLFQQFEFVIDKTPRYWEIVNEIHDLFPKSKIILLKRHPVAVAESMIKTWDLNSIKNLIPYKRDLLIAPKTILLFEKDNINNEKVYSLHYEKLLANPLEETKAIYDWIGITFNSSVLDIRNNLKYKGIFGDPFLNSENGYKSAKAVAKKKVLTSSQKNFLKGYSNFLGEDFLFQFGNYRLPRNSSKKTFAFSYFLHLCTNRQDQTNFRNEFKYLLKKGFFSFYKP